MAVYVSDLLTVTPAPVDATPTSTRTLQWLRGSTTISGVTSTTYTTTADDIGSTISARQSETNFLGTATATSAPTEVIQAFDPIRLFSASEPGVWYDPNDISTLFQDAAGTIPVTGPVGPAGQAVPVGLMLDKSRGLVLGPEKVNNPGPFTSTTGWLGFAATLAVNNSRLQVTPTDGSSRSGYQGVPTVVGVRYKVTAQYDQGTTTGVLFRIRNTAPNDVIVFTSATFTGAGAAEFYFVAGAVTSVIELATAAGNTGNSAFFNNISVKEVPGNHATQSITASQPIYGIVPAGGRRNLLTWTEDFSNPAWSTGGLALSAGSSAASQIITATTTNGALLRFVSVSPNAVVCTNSIEIRRITGTGPIELKLPGNGGNVITVTSDWTRFSSSGPAGGPFDYYLLQIATIGDALEIRYPQAELGSTATPYQRVTTQYDVTEAGVASLGYLFFDGSGDFMSTGTITPGTDKAQVFAGVRKTGPTAGSFGVIVESSSIVDSNPGSLFVLSGSFLGTQTQYSSLSRGNAAVSASQGAVSAASFTAPTTDVLTSQHDISGDLSAMRVDGVASGTNGTGDQGTGNFLAYPLYLGGRAGTSLFFVGQLFPLIVRFGPNLTTARIQSTEIWVGERTPGIDLEKFFSPLIYTRSGDTILDRANSTIERRAV